MIYRLVLLVLTAVIATATTMTPTHTHAQSPASAALLRLDDLPAGWSVTDTDVPPGTGAVGDECGGGPPIAPVSYAVAQFQAGPDGPFMIQSVALFSPGEVERAWAYYVQDWSSCGGTRPQDPPFTPLPVAGLGDERITRELVAMFSPVSTQLLVAIWRRGDAIASINITGAVARGGVETALTEHLARLVDERLRHLAAAKRS